MILYTTIKTEEIELINWSYTFNKKQNVRYNNAGTRFIISFSEEHADYFMNFNGIEPMLHSVAYDLVNTKDWTTIEIE